MENSWASQTKKSKLMSGSQSEEFLQILGRVQSKVEMFY